MTQQLTRLFSPYQLGPVTLKNRITMAPMTRSRAIGNIPNDLVTRYYADRATAGLIITEGISPSPNGLGYARIPGLFSDEQQDAWKKVTDAVRKNSGVIFAQLMHTGRVSHPLNLPEGAEVIAPSAVPPTQMQMWTDQQQMQPFPSPRPLETEEIKALIDEYVSSAKRAVAAGFHGIEIHAANGYLPMQFLNEATNQRIDQYGGSPENRNRFVIELATAIANEIGKERTGIRISPFNTFNEMGASDAAQYNLLVEELARIGVVYVHLLTFNVPAENLAHYRKLFKGTIILNGAYTSSRAEEDLEQNKADLISFGAPFIANPDLVKRFAEGIELATPDTSTFYTPGEKGYTDYPFAK